MSPTQRDEGRGRKVVTGTLSEVVSVLRRKEHDPVPEAHLRMLSLLVPLV